MRTPPPDIREIKPDLPEGLAEFIRGALIKDPEERLSDPDEIQRLLDLDGSGPGVWSDAAERVIHIRYRPAAAGHVQGAVDRLLVELQPARDVEVASGLLERATARPGEPGGGEDR